MEEKNNNMEEFFQRSLEQFDEVPSSQVWEKIDVRLDEDQKWYSSLFAWFKTLIPLLLALLIIGAYHLYSSNKINSSDNHLLSAQQTIQKLEKENQKLSILINQNNERINSYSVQLQLNEKQYNSLNDQFVNLNTSFRNNQKKLNTVSQTENSTYRDLLLMYHNQSKELHALHSKISIESTSVNSSSQKKSIVARPPVLNKSDSYLIPKISSYFYPIKDILIIKTLEGLNKNKGEALADDEAETNSKVRKFRFGVNARYFNTLVKSSNLVNPGFSWGLRAEYKLGNKWFITSDLHYNDQVYIVDPGPGGFSQESLKKYPLGIDNGNSVKNISTRSKYFDYNLGIKYLINPAKNKFNFYVNPSIVWQLYLPQEYTYGLAQANDLFHTQREYTGYLGSGNLRLGIERNLNERMLFQLNLWGEQSFIELGYDKQFVTMVGVGSSILF